MRGSLSEVFAKKKTRSLFCKRGKAGEQPGDRGAATKPKAAQMGSEELTSDFLGAGEKTKLSQEAAPSNRAGTKGYSRAAASKRVEISGVG